MTQHIILIKGKIRFCLLADSTEELREDLKQFLTLRKPYWYEPPFKEIQSDPKLIRISISNFSDYEMVVEEAKKFDLHFLNTWTISKDYPLGFYFGGPHPIYSSYVPSEPPKYKYVEEKDWNTNAILLSY